MDDKNIVLSISLLTSNRIDTIPRCLESLKPILEAIPSELIIVDTSDNPEVYECNLKYTDKVEKFEWCNDFAKARNVGVNQAKGQWFMFLDDDEWFIDSAPIIEFFKSGEYKEYGSACYLIRNYLDKDFTRYRDEWIFRLVKMHEDTQFLSKIHEYIRPVEGDTKQIKALVGHTGYIYETEEQHRAHFERNSSLLKRMEEEEPDNLRWKIHLMQEYRSIDEWEELEEYGRGVVEYIHTKRKTCSQIELMQVYITYLNALYINKKYSLIKEFYQNYFKHTEASFYGKAFMQFIMSISCFHLEEFELAEQYMGEYLKLYKMREKNPKKWTKEEVHIIINKAFSESTVGSAQIIYLLTKIHQKKYNEIPQAYENIDWSSEEQGLYYNVHHHLIVALLEMNDYDMLKRFLQDILSTKHLKTRMLTYIAQRRSIDKNVFEKLMNLVKEIDIWDWYKIYMELVSSEQMSVDEVKEIAISMVKESPNVFLIPEMLCTALANKGIDLTSLFSGLDFVTWKTQLVDHFACINMMQLEALKERLSNSSFKQDVRYAYFMMLYAEQKIREVTEQINSSKSSTNVDYNELLGIFSYYTCITYEALYGEQIQSMEPEELPENYQAALWLQIFFEEAEKDLNAALPCLDKVVEVYPFMKEFVETYKKS